MLLRDLYHQVLLRNLWSLQSFKISQVPITHPATRVATVHPSNEMMEVPCCAPEFHTATPASTHATRRSRRDNSHSGAYTQLTNVTTTQRASFCDNADQRQRVADVALLQAGHWINDAIISFVFEELRQRTRSPLACSVALVPPDIAFLLPTLPAEAVPAVLGGVVTGSHSLVCPPL